MLNSLENRIAWVSLEGKVTCHPSWWREFVQYLHLGLNGWPMCCYVILLLVSMEMRKWWDNFHSSFLGVISGSWCLLWFGNTNNACKWKLISVYDIWKIIASFPLQIICTAAALNIVHLLESVQKVHDWFMLLLKFKLTTWKEEKECCFFQFFFFWLTPIVTFVRSFTD